MDALKAEIASKRKAAQDDPTTSSRPNKYMRRGDIEKLKEVQELKEREEKEHKVREEREEAEAKRAAKSKAKVSISLPVHPVRASHPWMENRPLQGLERTHLPLVLLVK